MDLSRETNPRTANKTLQRTRTNRAADLNVMPLKVERKQRWFLHGFYEFS